MAPTPASGDGPSILSSDNYHANSKGGLEYIRKIPRAIRPLLTTGPHITIVDHQGIHIMTFPLALFNAASTNKHILVANTITLPHNYDPTQTRRFLSMMLLVPQHGCVCPFDKTDNTFIDLHFHSAAEFLGMDTFAQAVFDLYFKRVHMQIPAVPNIEAIALVRTPPGDKIFKQMAYKIGVDYYENKIADRAGFEKYLDKNERLRLAVEDVLRRKQRAAQREVNKGSHYQGYLEREKKRQNYARGKAKREERWESVKTRGEEEEKEREDHEKEVRRSMLEKKRTRQPMTREETKAHESVFGKEAPY